MNQVGSGTEIRACIELLIWVELRFLPASNLTCLARQRHKYSLFRSPGSPLVVSVVDPTNLETRCADLDPYRILSMTATAKRNDNERLKDSLVHASASSVLEPFSSLWRGMPEIKCMEGGSGFHRPD